MGLHSKVCTLFSCTATIWLILASFKTLVHLNDGNNFELIDWSLFWCACLSMMHFGFRRSYSSPRSRLQYYAVRSSLAKNMCFCRYVCVCVCAHLCVFLNTSLLCDTVFSLNACCVWSTFEKSAYLWEKVGSVVATHFELKLLCHIH